MRTSKSAQLVYTKIQVHKEHSFDYFVSFDLRESGIKKLILRGDLNSRKRILFLFWHLSYFDVTDICLIY